MVRLMLKAKNLPGTFWGEAIYTAVYIHNRTFCKGVNSKTSFELWYERTPAVHHLRVFGCVVHVKNTKPHLKKLEDKSKSMIFVSYEPGQRRTEPTTRPPSVSSSLVTLSSMRTRAGSGGRTPPLR
jgi:hypothetical protein